MGNDQSMPQRAVHRNNFYQLCNIMPDVPTCHHTLWVDEKESSSHGAATTGSFLDRRFDLDVAPSMLNMNLEWNGAYMVAVALYNVVFRKHGCKFLISTQALHWRTLKRVYRLHDFPSPHVHYTLSLSALLETARLHNICSEKDFSIYASRTPSTAALDEPERLPEVSDGSFYRLRYYYMPSDKALMRAALQNDTVVLANLAVFTNFLKFRKGVVEPPTDSDECVGMLAVLIIGYQDDMWIVRFPLGRTWGDVGIGYVAFDYFDRYCRDRWVVDVDQFRRPDEDADATALGLFCAEQPAEQAVSVAAQQQQQQKPAPLSSAQMQHRRRMF
jgi:hypothetical protein